MPIEIEWLDRAKASLRSILGYIAQDKPTAALTYVNEITDSVDRLRDFPESGRRFNRRYRVLIVRKHLVFYRYIPADGRVVVSAVVDGRQDIAKALRELKQP